MFSFLCKGTKFVYDNLILDSFERTEFALGLENGIPSRRRYHMHIHCYLTLITVVEM